MLSVYVRPWVLSSHPEGKKKERKQESESMTKAGNSCGVVGCRPGWGDPLGTFFRTKVKSA